MLYPTNITNYTPGVYNKKFKELLTDAESIIDQYIAEIYNISANSIRFKKKFSRLSTNTLVMGLVVGLILFFFLP